MENLDRARAAARTTQPSPQVLEGELRAVALAQRREVKLAAVAAGVAVRVEVGVLAEIADRSDRDGALAPVAGHGRGVLVLFPAM
jgi:hypothetical protein